MNAYREGWLERARRDMTLTFKDMNCHTRLR
jgi:hypothetical protein